MQMLDKETTFIFYSTFGLEADGLLDHGYGINQLRYNGPKIVQNVCSRVHRDQITHRQS